MMGTMTIIEERDGWTDGIICIFMIPRRFAMLEKQVLSSLQTEPAEQNQDSILPPFDPQEPRDHPRAAASCSPATV